MYVSNPNDRRIVIFNLDLSNSQRKGRRKHFFRINGIYSRWHLFVDKVRYSINNLELLYTVLRVEFVLFNYFVWRKVSYCCFFMIIGSISSSLLAQSVALFSLLSASLYTSLSLSLSFSSFFSSRSEIPI